MCAPCAVRILPMSVCILRPRGPSRGEGGGGGGDVLGGWCADPGKRPRVGLGWVGLGWVGCRLAPEAVSHGLCTLPSPA